MPLKENRQALKLLCLGVGHMTWALSSLLWRAFRCIQTQAGGYQLATEQSKLLSMSFQPKEFRVTPSLPCAVRIWPCPSEQESNKSLGKVNIRGKSLYRFV